MYATEEYIKLLTSALSDKADVKLKPSKEWATNLTTNTLHYVPQDLRNMPFEFVRGVLLHEIGHLRYSDKVDTPTAKEKKYGKSMHHVYNAFEDIRIESQLRGDYGNFASSAIDFLNCSASYKFINGKKPRSKLEQFLKTMLLRTHVGDGYGGHHKRDLYEKVGYRANDFVKNNPLKLDKKVMKKFEGVDSYQKSETLNKIDNAIKYAAERRTYSTEGIKKYVDKYVFPIIKEFLEEESKSPKMAGKPSMKPGGKGVGAKGNEKTPITERPSEKEAGALLKPYSQTLAQRLQSVLKEKAMIKWHGNHKRGKLLSKNAYKVCIPNETRVFSKRNTPDNPHYSVYFAIDGSGSMNGGRDVYAFMGAVLLKQTCDILGFKSKFYEYDTRAEVLDDLEDYGQTGGGTNDTCALIKIEEDMSAEDDNIVMVLTDGGVSRNDDEYRTIYNKIKKKGSQIFGIGIGGDEIREDINRNYDNGAYVEDVKELPKAIINIMRQVIKR